MNSMIPSTDMNAPWRWDPEWPASKISSSRCSHRTRVISPLSTSTYIASMRNGPKIGPTFTRFRVVMQPTAWSSGHSHESRRDRPRGANECVAETVMIALLMVLKRRPELHIPGQSVQVEVKHLKTQSGRLYQFTAIDEATRYRVLKIYEHNSIQSAIQFINEVRQAFPVAIRRIQTDNGSEWGTDFTWHLHDLGIAHRHIPPSCPESNGKVERSHRTDENEFYWRVTFRTRSELVRKLRAWEHEYNRRRLHLALGGKTPAERLAELRIAPAACVLRSA